MLKMRKVINRMCEYHVMSCDPIAYLQSIAEMLLYLLLPEDDFQNKALCFILRVRMFEGHTPQILWNPQNIKLNKRKAYVYYLKGC